MGGGAEAGGEPGAGLALRPELISEDEDVGSGQHLWAEWWVGQAGSGPGVSTGRGQFWALRCLVSPCPTAVPGLAKRFPDFQWVPL